MPKFLEYFSLVTKTISNTAIQSSLLPNALGEFVSSVSAFDNLFLDRLGATLILNAAGIYGTKAGAVGTLRIAFSLDGNIILDTGTFTPLTNLVNVGWSLNCFITVRSIGVAGSIIGQGLFRHQSTSTSFAERPMINAVTSVINTENLQTMDLTATWSTADIANTISSTNVKVSIE